MKTGGTAMALLAELPRMLALTQVGVSLRIGSNDK
jgi:hypothetical protein